MTSAEYITEAMLNFGNTFGNDLSLVADSASHHGIATSVANILTCPESMTYSARIPYATPEEADALMTATTITLLCMDYRQAETVARQTGASVFIADAGGAAQPEEHRFQQTVAFFQAVGVVNPGVTMILTGHSGVCGGANYYTGGAMTDLFAQSPRKEADAMKSYIHNLGAALVSGGFPDRQIRIMLAHVDHDQMTRLEKI